MRHVVGLCLLATFVAGGPAVSFPSWPNPSKTNPVTKTILIKAGQVYDGKNERFVSQGLGDGGQGEHQKALFLLEKGATLMNVVIGKPAADGVHSEGACKLVNVWWEHVGEDAATFRGDDPNAVYSVTGGGARDAADKVFQQNGPGTTIIEGFQFLNCSKGYRSCGNCKNNGFARHVIMNNIKVTGNINVLAGINGNYGDTAKLTNIIVDGKIKSLCTNFKGTSNNNVEPLTVSKAVVGQAGDHKSCLFDKADILNKIGQLAKAA